MKTAFEEKKKSASFFFPPHLRRKNKNAGMNESIRFKLKNELMNAMN